MPSKETLELIGKATALAALLFTALSFVYGQNKERAAGRYAASVELMDRYRTEGIREAETTLAQRLLYYRVDGLDPNDPGDYTEQLFDGIAKEVLFGDTGSDTSPVKPFLPRLFLISDFYSEVTFCLESAICNSEILISYFCPRATAFLARNKRLLEYYSIYSSSEDLTYGPEKLVDHCTN